MKHLHIEETGHERAQHGAPQARNEPMHTVVVGSVQYDDFIVFESEVRPQRRLGN